jgi:queuine tRNA-ribosyltransferase
MPDATRASIRGVTTSEAAASGIEALVVNTYHLFLQPGEVLIGKSGLARNATHSVAGGGIHRFMHWDGPILSDSGGYQVYSLIHRNPEMGEITEEGVAFKSIFDGSRHLLTPERAIQIQFDLGVDMMVCLDDPRPNDAPEEEVHLAVERTIRWAKRCKVEYEKQIIERGLNDQDRPLLFGVVQGGLFISLRKKCADGLTQIGFDGYGFGGRHIGEDGNFLEEILEKTASFIPEESIRFALGIGTPSDIVRCHALGWDMFDCVIPTREGRHGRLFVHKKSSMAGNRKLVTGNIPEITADKQTASITNYQLPITSSDFYQTINIVNERFREDFTPVDPDCDCELCMKYTKAYLKHLFKVGDPLAGRLASLHNLRFYVRLMESLRTVST